MKEPYRKQETKPYSKPSGEDYLYGLSKVVNEACEKWLANRGLKTKTWKQTKDEDFNRKEKTVSSTE